MPDGQHKKVNLVQFEYPLETLNPNLNQVKDQVKDLIKNLIKEDLKNNFYTI